MSRQAAAPAEFWGNEFALGQTPVHEKWTSEFLQADNRQQPLQPQGVPASVPRGVDKDLLARLQNSANSKIRQSKFVKFLSRLSSGEISLNTSQNKVVENAPTQAESGKDWAEQYANLHDPGHAWSNEFEQRQHHHGQRESGLAEEKEEFSEQSSSWAQEFSEASHDVADWLNEFQNFDWEEYVAAMQRAKEMPNPTLESRRIYNFKADNPFSGVEAPMEEGIQLMRDGNLCDAVLAFEAEVQRSPSNSEAWRYLGQCNAENESESQCIAALQKAVMLDPYSLDSLLLLGVSHTNDLEQSHALNSLKAWLEHHPDYQFLKGEGGVASEFERMYGAADPSSPSELHGHVVDMFLRAVRAHPNDADLHTVLGVLFNISAEYDRAIDSFRTAVKLRPDDASLWNKLGATQANGSYSEMAVDAYRHALQLKPNYVRALANLGISFANQGMQKEAAQAYLATLSRNPRAEHVWSYLKIALSAMNLHNLATATDQRDVELFRSHFEF